MRRHFRVSCPPPVGRAGDCRPGAIAKALQLKEPKYVETAAYCHFGREPREENGITQGGLVKGFFSEREGKCEGRSIPLFLIALMKFTLAP